MALSTRDGDCLLVSWDPGGRGGRPYSKRGMGGSLWGYQGPDGPLNLAKTSKGNLLETRLPLERGKEQMENALVHLLPGHNNLWIGTMEVCELSCKQMHRKKNWSVLESLTPLLTCYKQCKNK